MTTHIRDLRDVADLRLRVQGLAQPRFHGLADAVGFFGAIQSQDIGPSEWAVAQRCVDGGSRDEIVRSLASGEVLRTHVLRPTWHWVAATDIRTWLRLTGSRVLVQHGSYMRKFGVDQAVLDRSHAAIESALRGGRSLPRSALDEALRQKGIDTSELRLVLIVMHAELTGLICSGPAAKQPTYALLDERVPPEPPSDRDDDLVRLTLRYFASHGPATERDFQWWSSLTLADIRRAIDLIRDDLSVVEVDSHTLWYVDMELPDASATTANLIHILDEYVVGYRESRSAADEAGFESQVTAVRELPQGVVLIDGQVVGRWSTSRRSRGVGPETVLYRDLEDAEEVALEAATQQHAQFWGGGPAGEGRE
jgi:hypothetical protein